MKSYVLSVITLIVIVGAIVCVAQEKVCSGENEEYLVCGTSCPETCETLKSKSPKVCNDKCNDGCFCKGVHVRNKNNKCILPKDCP